MLVWTLDWDLDSGLSILVDVRKSRANSMSVGPENPKLSDDTSHFLYQCYKVDFFSATSLNLNV